MTAGELVIEVEKRLMRQREMVPEEYKEKWDRDRPTATQATCWFLAVHESKAVWEAYSTKDLAEVIREGGVLAGPFKTIEDIETWIEILEEDAVGTWEWLGEELDAFYGLHVERKEEQG